MKKLLPIVLGLSCCIDCSADTGGSFSVKGFSEAEYVVLNLSEDQLEEVESLRRVTLSKAQLAELRRLAPDFPKRVGVASPFVEDIVGSRFAPWPDQITAVWFCRDTVAIPRASLGGGKGCREFSKSLNAGDAVLIDTKGEYGIGSRGVSREKLAETLELLAGKEPEGKSFQIFILRPPVLESEEEQLVQSSVENLTQICQKYGIGCRIGG